MPEFDNEMRGVLFVNSRKENENQPDFTGSCQVNGKTLRLAAWKKTSRAGNPFMSVSFSDPREGGQGGQGGAEDDIPF